MNSLNGSNLRIVTRWDNMYKYDVEVEALNKTSYRLSGGYSVSILRELSIYLNFSYTLCPEVQTFEFEKAETHGIDIFLASYSLYESRAKIVDPTFIIGSSHVYALLNHDYEDLQQSIFAEPFHTHLWYTILAFLILICVFSFFISFSEDVNIKEIAFHGISLTMQKATTINLEKFNSRLIMWIICLASTLIMACYCGQMVSLFTIHIFKIQSLEALVESNYNILLEKGYNNGSPIQIIAESLKDIPVMNKLLQKASKSNFKFETFEKGIELVHNSPSSYIIDEQTGTVAIKNSLGHFPCTWSKIPVMGIHYPWSMLMRKRSPYKSAINFGLLRLDEVGLLWRARRQMIPSDKECELKHYNHGQIGHSHSSMKDGVPLHQVYSAFVIFSAGVIWSVVIFLIFENNKYSRTY